MNAHDFYRSQSEMSDPGRYAGLFDALPDDVAGLAAVVRNITLHYRAGKAVGFEIPRDRLVEIDTRRCELMLERIVALDGRPLAEPRDPSRRIIGCCRDAALLLCAMLRHKGVPARLRYGFAPYLGDGSFNGDHSIVEYWDGGRWVLADAEQGRTEIPFRGGTFSPLDIPLGAYLPAGMAWQLARSGKADPDTFGVSPELRGMVEIRLALVIDIAMLNRNETLLWDVWGVGSLEGELGEDDLALLDHAAAVSTGTDVEAALPEIVRLYEDRRLALPGTIMSMSPAQGPRQVELAGTA